jgi:hypothetical protein
LTFGPALALDPLLIPVNPCQVEALKVSHDRDKRAAASMNKMLQAKLHEAEVGDDGVKRYFADCVKV